MKHANGLIANIAIRQPSAPSSEKIQWDRMRGRNEGSATACSRKATVFRAP